MLHCEEPGGCLLRTGVVATVGSDTPMPSDNASLIQTQGSQTESAPKKVICYSYSLQLNCMC